MQVHTSTRVLRADEIFQDSPAEFSLREVGGARTPPPPGDPELLKAPKARNKFFGLDSFMTAGWPRRTSVVHCFVFCVTCLLIWAICGHQKWGRRGHGGSWALELLILPKAAVSRPRGGPSAIGTKNNFPYQAIGAKAKHKNPRRVCQTQTPKPKLQNPPRHADCI